MAEPFYLGTWAQPPENLLIWKPETNVAIGPEIGNPPRFTQAAVHQKCADMGLFYISVPLTSQDLERMVLDPWCLAIGLPDEMDLKIRSYNQKDDGSNPPTVGEGFKKDVAAVIAANDWIVKQTAGRKRLYTNFAGPKVLAGTQDPVKPYLLQNQQPFVNWINSIPRRNGVLPHILSSDFYPENQNYARYPTHYPADCISVMKKIFGTSDFVYWAYVECSDQVLDKTEDPNDPKNIGRAPTSAEMDEEVNFLLDAGAQGVTWFSHKFNIGWNIPDLRDGWDGRNDEQRAKTKAIAAKLLTIQAPIDPLADLKASIQMALQNDTQTMSVLSNHEARLSSLEKSLKTLADQSVTDVTLRRGLSPLP